MNQYVGLDVSLEETKIHVLDEAGGRAWRGKCASHPDELEQACAGCGSDRPRDRAVDHLALDGTE